MLRRRLLIRQQLVRIGAHPLIPAEIYLCCFSPECSGVKAAGACNFANRFFARACFKQANGQCGMNQRVVRTLSSGGFPGLDCLPWFTYVIVGVTKIQIGVRMIGVEASTILVL